MESKSNSQPETQLEHLLSELHELNPNALSFDGFDNCIIGYGCQYTKDPVLIYDEQKMVEHLVWNENWSFEEAWDYLCFNTFCAWVGEGTPIVLRAVNDL